MSSPKRVFVVDDEHTISWTLGMILNANGFIAETFTDPLDALRSASPELPDLLISDVRMPGLSGIDLAVQIKSLRPGCKVILISGQAATDDMLAPARKRGLDFLLLTKPVHPHDLVAAASAAWHDGAA